MVQTNQSLVSKVFTEDKTYNEVRNFVEDKYNATLKSTKDLERTGLLIICEQMGGTLEEQQERAVKTKGITKSVAKRLGLADMF